MLQVRGAVANGPAMARLSAGRRVCRKYRKAYIQKLQQQEYDRLRNMVPSLAAADKQRKKRVSKVKVIEATIRYIDQLHHALAERLRADDATKVKDEQVARAANRLFVVDAKGRSSPPGGGALSTSSVVVCQKERRIPSYLLQSEVLSRNGD